MNEEKFLSQLRKEQERGRGCGTLKSRGGCVPRKGVCTARCAWPTCLCSVVNSPLCPSSVCKHTSHGEGGALTSVCKPRAVSWLPAGAYEVCFALRSRGQHRWEDP